MAAPSAIEFGGLKKKSKDESHEETSERIYKVYEERINNLPEFKGFFNLDYRLYKGTYYNPAFLSGVMSMQEHFNARSSDVFIASFVKTGTTWLKALVFAIVNRNKYGKDNHPLLAKVPHDIIPTLEMDIYRILEPTSLMLDDIPSPRLFGTHAPYTLLPNSIINTNPKIIYICRDPKDVFISLYFFLMKVISQTTIFKDAEKSVATNYSLRDAYDDFCKGILSCGPYWDHVLSYYKASIERPQNFMFLKYEDLKRDAQSYVIKLAEFLGLPFSPEEEADGTIQHIVNLCSFEFLSNLQVTKTGTNKLNYKNDAFYRKGNVGDWKNHLTVDMAEHLDLITKQKFEGHDLCF